MKFKLLGDSNNNVIDNILNRQGVTRKQIDTPRNIITRGYHNMEEAVRLIIDKIHLGKKIAILADEDADGYCSATILYRYFKDMDYDVDIITHYGKVHGVTTSVVEYIKENEIDLLLVPDAGSNDELLGCLNCEVVVIDHHQIEKEVPLNTIRVNNQDELNVNSNKNLTGVGMCYRVLQELDQALGLRNADNNLDVVAIGQIADSSDISDEEIRYIVNRGIENIHNKLFLAMLRDRFERKETITPRDLSFEVIPYINAVCRVGTKEERKHLLEAMCGMGEYWDVYTIKRRRKDKSNGKFKLVDIHLTQCDRYFSTELCEIKKRQNEIVTETLKTIVENVYGDGGIVVAIGSKEIDKSITGLIASKITALYNRPAILLLNNENQELYTGSIRGKETVVDSLKHWCEDTGLFNWVLGHDNASGCSIDKDNIEELVEKTKTIIPKDYLEVDYLCTKLSPDMIDYFYENRRYYGGRVDYPKIGIENLPISKLNVSMRGANTLVIEQGGIDYIIFNVSQEDKALLTNGFSPVVHVDIYGEPSINYFRGKKNRQVIVNKIALTEKEIDMDFDF